MAAEMVIRLVDGSDAGLSPANDIPQPNEVPTVGSVRPKIPDPVPTSATPSNTDKDSTVAVDGEKDHSEGSVFLESMEEFTRRVETAIQSLSKPSKPPKTESQKPVANPESQTAANNDASAILSETIGSVRKYMPKWLDAFLADVQKSIPSNVSRSESKRTPTTVAELNENVAAGSFELERLVSETNRLLGLIAERGGVEGEGQGGVASEKPSQSSTPEGPLSTPEATDRTIPSRTNERASSEQRHTEVLDQSRENAFPSISPTTQPSPSQADRDRSPELSPQRVPSSAAPSVQPPPVVARQPSVGTNQPQSVPAPSVKAPPSSPAVSDNKSKPSEQSGPSFSTRLTNRIINRVRGSKIARSKTVQRIAQGAKSVVSRSSKALLNSPIGKRIATSSVGRAIGSTATSIGARIAGTAAGAGAKAAGGAAASGTAAGAGAAGTGGVAAVAAVAAPVAIAVAAFATVALAAKGLRDAFEGVADSLEKYSADISLARSQRQANTEINLVERAKVLGPKLAPLENANTRLQDANERLGTRILEAVSPLASGLGKVVDVLTVGVESVNVGFASVKVAFNTLDDLTDQDFTDDRVDQAKLAKAATDLAVAIDRFNGIDGANGNDPLDAEFQRFLALGGK